MKRERVVQQFADRQAWRENRQTFIGASDAAAIVGVCPFRSALEVWASKTGFDVPKEQSEAMLWGQLLEPVVAGEVANRLGRPVRLWDQAAVIRDPERNWQACTPDAFLEDAEQIVQIKTTRFASCDFEHDELPLAYQVQVQHELMVTGCELAYLAILVAGQKLVIRQIEPDADFQRWLTDREQEFWDLVINRVPPRVDDSYSCRKALNAMTGPGAVAIVGEQAMELMEADTELGQVKEDLKVLEARKRLLENQILAAMAGHEQITLPNNVGYSYKQQTRKAHMVEESTFRVLRRSGK